MTTPKPAPKKGAIIELDQEDFQGEVVIHKNLSQDVVLTTEDKLRLALIQHRETLNSRAEWVGAGVLVISFLSTLLLTTFDVMKMSCHTGLLHQRRLPTAVEYGTLRGPVGLWRVGISWSCNRKRVAHDPVSVRVLPSGAEGFGRQGRAEGQRPPDRD